MLYQSVLLDHPTNLAAARSLAEFYLRAGNLSRSLRYFYICKGIDPDDFGPLDDKVTAVAAEQTRLNKLRLKSEIIRLQLLSKYGNRVLDGPFKGMELVTDVSGNDAFDSSWNAYLLGIYEFEIHYAVEKVIIRSPKTVVNIGSAGGYYAVGMALRLSSAMVYAFDVDQNAQLTTQTMATINDVHDRVVVGGVCSTSILNQLLNEDTCIICDIEGYELQLLEPRLVPQLKRVTILVELHDGLVPGLSFNLLSKFSDTHTITRYATVPRGNRGMPQIDDEHGLGVAEVTFATSDHRDDSTTWALLEPIVAHSPTCL